MIKTLSPMKSNSPVLSSELSIKSPLSPKSGSPERNFSVFSPILDKSQSSMNALCNSPAEMEDGDVQATFDFTDLKVEDEKRIFVSTENRHLKKTESKLSIYKFGLLPLEAIEESANEDVRCRVKRRTVIHKSQHTSPRMVFDGTGVQKERNIKRKMTMRELGSFKSPYSVGTQLSPNRLPALKPGEKGLKPVKSHIVLRKRKEG